MTTLVFSIINTSMIFFWALMIFVPKSSITQKIISYPYVPLILSFGYIFFLSQVPDIFKADFSSLDGILELFKNSTPESAAAGWIHYLAFDFWMGAWILKNAQKIKIPHLLIIAPLICTFMLGPFGVLLYVILSKGYLKFKKNE
tara:strand:- start:274 stop:705 length:432 start_codon:yes stop_codon:yes gene_type:complete